MTPSPTSRTSFYDSIFDECHKYGIEPLVTICHFDTPIALIKKYGGWKDRRMVDAYVHYCEVLFDRFKGKVKYWLTFNESTCCCTCPLPAPAGIPPRRECGAGQVSGRPSRAGGQRKGGKLAHENAGRHGGLYAGGGSVLPRTCAPEDVRAAQEADRDNYFFTDVQVRGAYPVWAKKRMERAGCSCTHSPRTDRTLREARWILCPSATIPAAASRWIRS